MTGKEAGGGPFQTGENWMPEGRKSQSSAPHFPAREEIERALSERHTPEVQRKLSAARAAVAGLGGLGSNIALWLARLGVGHILLVDFDRVDLSNLNRQQYFLRHLGMEKTEAMTELLREVNPYLDVRAVCCRVTEESIPELFREWDYILEAFDRPEEKAMLVNGILEHFPEKTLIAASGMAGIGRSKAIQTRKISEHFYLCGDGCSESAPGAGLMAPRVALCAAHQANLAAELIIERA